MAWGRAQGMRVCVRECVRATGGTSLAPALGQWQHEVGGGLLHGARAAAVQAVAVCQRGVQPVVLEPLP